MMEEAAFGLNLHKKLFSKPNGCALVFLVIREDESAFLNMLELLSFPVPSATWAMRLCFVLLPAQWVVSCSFRRFSVAVASRQSLGSYWAEFAWCRTLYCEQVRAQRQQNECVNCPT